MRRRRLLTVLAIGFAVALLSSTVASAQARHPAPGPGHGGGPTVVVRGGFYGGWGWGYPYYSPFWGFGPWYPYWGWGMGYYWPGYDTTGSVRLQVTPKQAEVFVDGYYVGVVDDFDGTFQRLHVPPGGHELVLYLEGYRTVRQTFYATTGKDFKVTFAMVPLAAGEPNEPRPVPANPPPQRRNGQPVLPPEAESQTVPEPPAREPAPAVRADVRGFGTLAVRVQPSGADIVVDGERWRGPEGQERLLIQLSEGTHTVEIRKAGYVTFSTDIQVRPGQTEALNVSLPRQDPQ